MHRRISEAEKLRTTGELGILRHPFGRSEMTCLNGSVSEVKFGGRTGLGHVRKRYKTWTIHE
jgi:hypothetical protein